MATNVPNPEKTESYRLKNLSKSKQNNLKTMAFRCIIIKLLKKPQKILNTAEENCKLHPEKQSFQWP